MALAVLIFSEGFEKRKLEKHEALGLLGEKKIVFNNSQKKYLETIQKSHFRYDIANNNRLQPLKLHL